MDSFSPFVPLLPRSVRSALTGERGVSYHCATLKSHWSTVTQRLKTFSRPGVRIKCPGKWESFDTYARRVRAFSQTTLHGHCMICGIIGNYRQAVYQRVSTMRQKHLFPNLRDFVWVILDSRSLESWSLPSSLRSLTIYQPNFTCLDEVLRHAAHDAPDLESLEIRFGLPDRSAPYTTVDPLPFSHLKSVALICLDLARVGICHSLSLAPMTVLSTSVVISDSAKMWQPRSLVFHTLEVLCVTGDPFPVSLFIKHVRGTRLREVGCILHRNPDITFSDCQELLDTVLLKMHGQSLRALSIVINSKKLFLENPSTFDQLIKDFLRELRLYVLISAIETVILVLSHNLTGEKSDVEDGFWYYYGPSIEALKTATSSGPRRCSSEFDR
ncbi:hypothetical protein BDR03DRAFT_365961 [Suillus americanus]|nr:hypothetical protein BDR03DRAFT_365961 [Suillus americanus]